MPLAQTLRLTQSSPVRRWGPPSRSTVGVPGAAQ